jgi:hypothetical protein
VPEIHCLFARPNSELHQLLLAEPTLADRVFVLPRCEGLDLAGGALTVVRLPYPPEDKEHYDAWAHHGPEFALAFAQFRWLRWILPVPELARWIWSLSQATGAPLSWFYWHERGDTLYNDAAMMFEPKARSRRPWLSISVATPSAFEDLVTSREGRRLCVREEFMASGAPYGAVFHLEAGTTEAWLGSPLYEAMDHIGIEAKTEYFVPTDKSSFDWERYRLRSA